MARVTCVRHSFTIKMNAIYQHANNGAGMPQHPYDSHSISAHAPQTATTKTREPGCRHIALLLLETTVVRIDNMALVGYSHMRHPLFVAPFSPPRQAHNNDEHTHTPH